MRPHEGGVRRLDWELTDKCNSRCVFCPREKYLKLGHGNSTMSKGAFSYGLSECVEAFSPDFINFGVFGEPTLCDYLPEAISQAKELGLTTRVSTNALLMDDYLATECLEAGLDRIHFSVDDILKKEFEQLRRGMIWENVLGNIVNFWKLKQLNDYDCRVEIYPVKCQENQDRIGDIVNFWGQFADRCRASPEVPVGDGHRTEPWYVPWYSPLLFPVLKRFGLTPHCYDWLVVRATGEVVPCCMDDMKEHVLGNIFKEKILDIWEGERARHFRDLFDVGLLPPLCQRCRYRRFFV